MLEFRREDGYEISSDRARIDVPKVHQWLSTDAYWAMGRSLERMRAALDGSETYGVYLNGHSRGDETPDGTNHGGDHWDEKRSGDQVAVARVVTDNTIFAYLCDVYVDRAHRGKGLGGWLVESLRDHLAGRGLTRFLLVTRDAQPLYARHGFTEVDPGRWMECDLSHKQRPAGSPGLTVQP